MRISGSPRKIRLVPLDDEVVRMVEAAQMPFINIPPINHLQECAETYRLINNDIFCEKCRQNKIGEPIIALNFEWYGRAEELLTMLLQRAVLGTESFLSCIVLQELAQRGLITEKTREQILNPFSLKGKGTADNYYNRLPGLVSPDYSLKNVDPALWNDVWIFYGETRNKIFHGYLLNSRDPKALLPYFEILKRLFLWIDGWYEDKVGTIMPIQIKRHWRMD